MLVFTSNGYSFLGCSLSALLASSWCYALEAELPVSILNMQYGNLLVVENSAVESTLWGYNQFDYRTKPAGKKNWHVTYNNNGSLSFKSLETNTCIAINDNSEVIHSTCNNNLQTQQFRPLLVSSGALQLKNLAFGRCLSSINAHYLSAYAITLEPCEDGVPFPVGTNLLWAFIPAQGPSTSLPQKQELR